MFNINDRVKVKAMDGVKVRRTPGYLNKDEMDIVIQAPQGYTFPVASGPHQADGLDWYEVDLGGQRGYAAEAHDGDTLLEPDMGPAPVCGIVLTRPVHASIPVTQNWGENPDFYAQIQGYEAPLQGHNGRDYGAPPESIVMACDDGVVQRAGMDPWGFGNLCVITHSWGRSFYAHLSAFAVSVGDSVRCGQPIARSGNTGLGMGAGGAGEYHLHFGIKIDGQDHGANGWGGFSDPTPYMDDPN